MFFCQLTPLKTALLLVLNNEGVMIVKINALIEPTKYNENRQIKDTYETKRKKEKEEQLSFSEVLKRMQKCG